MSDALATVKNGTTVPYGDETPVRKPAQKRQRAPRKAPQPRKRGKKVPFQPTLENISEGDEDVDDETPPAPPPTPQTSSNQSEGELRNFLANFNSHLASGHDLQDLINSLHHPEVAHTLQTTQHNPPLFGQDSSFSGVQQPQPQVPQMAQTTTAGVVGGRQQQAGPAQQNERLNVHPWPNANSSPPTSSLAPGNVTPQYPFHPAPGDPPTGKKLSKREKRLQFVELNVASDFKPRGFEISNRLGVYRLGDRIFFCSLQKKKYGKKGAEKSNYTFNIPVTFFQNIRNIADQLAQDFKLVNAQVGDEDSDDEEMDEAEVQNKRANNYLIGHDTMAGVTTWEGIVRCDIREYWYNYRGERLMKQAGIGMSYKDFKHLFLEEEIYNKLITLS